MKMDTYEKQAKELWGDTPAFREYEEKAKGRSPDDQSMIAADMMAIFFELGQIKNFFVRISQEICTDKKIFCTDFAQKM